MIMEAEVTVAEAIREQRELERIQRERKEAHERAERACIEEQMRLEEELMRKEEELKQKRLDDEARCRQEEEESTNPKLTKYKFELFAFSIFFKVFPNVSNKEKVFWCFGFILYNNIINRYL